MPDNSSANLAASCCITAAGSVLQRGLTDAYGQYFAQCITNCSVRKPGQCDA